MNMTIAPMTPMSVEDDRLMTEVAVRVRKTFCSRRSTPELNTSCSRCSAWYPLTTRTPPSDSVRRPVTSALILARSRKIGRMVRKALRRPNPNIPRKPKAMAVMTGLMRIKTAKAMTAEGELAALHAREVGMPIVVQRVGEDGGRLRLERLRPQAAVDVAEGHQWRIDRDHRGAHAAAAHPRPVPRRVPFPAAAGELVVRRVDGSVLALVREFRLRYREGERKVDGLLIVHRLFLQAIDDLDLLLAVE